MTFVKQATDKGPVWNLFNDTKILTYPTWKDVVHKVVSEKILPTVLVYEQLSNESVLLEDQKDSLGKYDIRELEKWARDQQKFVD